MFSHDQQVHWIKRETKKKAKTGRDLSAGMQKKRCRSLNEFYLIQLFTSNFIYDMIRGEHWHAEL